MWGQEPKEVLARIPGGDARTGVWLSPGSCAPAAMSSASSEPGNGDAAKQAQLGLDTVIQVSGGGCPPAPSQEQAPRAP